MNTEQEIKYIEKLLAAFFDGTTTTTDEKELYRFFKREDIPEHLKSYQPVFEYFETGLREELHTLPEDDYAIKKTKRHWVVWSGIAASLIFFISLGIQLYVSRQEFNPYEGSYIVRNGIRIDDPKAIKPHLEIAIKEMYLRQIEIDMIFNEVSDVNRKRKLVEEIQIDPHSEILGCIEDEFVRDKIRNMLDIK